MSTALTAPAVEVHDDIRDVAAGDWDSLLAADDLQATHRFVSACQAADIERAMYRHVLLRDGDGVLCVASFCAFAAHLELLAPRAVRSAIAALRRVAPRSIDQMLVFGGLPVSFNQSCLRIRPGFPIAGVIERLEPIVEEFAGAMHASIICLKEFDDVDAQRLLPINRFRYTHAWSLPTCTLPIRWRTFDDYLVELRSSYRHQILAALKKADQSGLRARFIRDDTREACRLLFPLYNQVMDRAEYQLERLNDAFFEQLGGLPETEVLLMERAEKVIAGAILLHGVERGTFLIAGVDYEHNRECQAYISLVTNVVRWGIECGFSELEMGQTSYALKMRFGAVPRARHLFLRHRGALGRKLLPAMLPILFPAHSFAPRRTFHVQDAELPG